jgi:tetratricopeptide (TPR) repeat protein
MKHAEKSDLRHKTLFNLGKVYRRIGLLEQSVEKLKEATSNCPKGVEATTFNNLGLSYFEQENYEEALSNFNKAY